LGHLDYLNQTQYIKAEFTAHANQEDVPSAVEAKEFDLESPTLAHQMAAHLITFKAAELTEKGRKMLERWRTPKSLKEGPSVPIATKDMPFLEKVLIKSGLEDIFDARDVTEVIYRAM